MLHTFAYVKCTMTGVTEASLKTSLKILRFLKMYPNDCNSCAYFLKALVTYLIFVVLLGILVILHLILDTTSTASYNFELICVCQISAVIIKNLPFIINTRKIKMCVSYFDQPIFAARTKEEKAIMKQSIFVCQRNATVFFAVVITALSLVITKSLFEGQYSIPIWLPSSMKISSTSWIAHIYTFIGLWKCYTRVF